MKSKVKVSIDTRVIPTYELGKPEKNPMFFEKRVYQGSSGKVYPVPFIDKVHDHKVDKQYKTVTLENDFIRLVLLPEIGGRIFEAQDKTNNNFDFFYKQDVIKPALVGLAGPWISGGVEFNWPQHHRPSTYMPCDVEVENHEDGSVTAWMSEYDPLNRLKGMHGICLTPNSALIELKARLYNTTPITQTFLWWANVAVRVHDDYQSFFPPDVSYVSDHAVRAMSSFPEAKNSYYGIDYKKREGANDLRWYKNIPVPTSYMVCETNYNFFGGYDHAAKGGFIHIADRHIAPGKKQWTWGNESFGQAWDRELTDNGGPYIELMSGVYTDNQPDFTYLYPYETKTFSQYWWPFKDIGPVQNANEHLALKLEKGDGKVALGLVSSRTFENIQVKLLCAEKILYSGIVSISPKSSWETTVAIQMALRSRLKLVILDCNGNELLSYLNTGPSNEKNRKQASEPKKAEIIETNSELNLVGEHLEQYRHPTRYPEDYWVEAIERDPNDYKAILSLAKSYLKQGDFTVASKSFDKAIEIETNLHPNPISGESHYYNGLCSMYLNDLEKAYKLFYKSIWNFEWRSAGYFMLANISSVKKDYKNALAHIIKSLSTNNQNNKALVLQSIIENELGNKQRGVVLLEKVLKRDPLDHWANFEQALIKNNFTAFVQKSRNDAQTIIDIVFDYAKAGFYKKAIQCIECHHEHAVTESATPNPLSVSPMTYFILAWLYAKQGNEEISNDILKEASKMSADYFFPSRIEEQIILKWALSKEIDKGTLAYGLGNYYYDKKRHADAIRIWEIGVSSSSDYATLYRNLGIAYWNYEQNGKKALRYYKTAVNLSNSEDMRILFEYDQLRKKLNIAPQERLESLIPFENKILTRDDFSVEYAALFNFIGDYKKVLELLVSKTFHPWEGGEGQVLKQYSHACIKLGEIAMNKNNPQEAFNYFKKSVETPDNLGEKYHPLQAKANIYYWLGKASLLLGNKDDAQDYFGKSSKESGDFVDMTVSEHSELTYYKALSLQELGRNNEAEELLHRLKDYAVNKLRQEAEIDYFATSLPLLLVFDENLQNRNIYQAKFLLALAELGLKNYEKTWSYLNEVIKLNAMHIGAKELKEQLEENDYDKTYSI